MNSDQGSHFTSSKYIKLFLESGAKISMDHRGRAYDNIFIKRLWRSLKYENIYLQDYQNPREARIGINSYLKYYNYKRPHQSLDYKTPAEIYIDTQSIYFPIKIIPVDKDDVKDADAPSAMACP